MASTTNLTFWDKTKKEAKFAWSNFKDLFTWEFYKEGFSGWSRISKIWVWIGLAVLTITSLMSADHSIYTFYSWLGGIIGFTCTLAITNHKRINGLLGFVSAILLITIALHYQNFADIPMQLGYIIALDIPVILYGNGWTKVTPRGMNKNGWITLFSVFILSYIILYFIDIYFGSPRPWLDAGSAAVGFTGAALMLGNYKSQYFAWALQGLSSIVLWAVTAYQNPGNANWVPMFIYILYMGNDIIGLFFSKWSYRKNKYTVVETAQIQK